MVIFSIKKQYEFIQQIPVYLSNFWCYRDKQKNRQKSLPSKAYITLVKFKISVIIFQSLIYVEFGMKWLLFSSVDFGLQPSNIETLPTHGHKLSGKQFCTEYQKL